MRVLVTRPRQQGERTARRLAELGHEAVVAPVLDIVETGETSPDGRPAALVVTSANAVAALVRERDRFGALPVFAVGAGTAQALAREGFPHVRHGAGDGAALAAEIAGLLRPGATLLHVCGRDTKAEPRQSLAAAGFEVVRWEVYHAQAAVSLPGVAAAALDAGRLDAVLHYSRRSAGIVAGLARQEGRGAALAGLAHLCLSDDVALGLLDLAPARLVVAAAPNESALLIALEDPACGVAPVSRPGTPGC